MDYEWKFLSADGLSCLYFLAEFWDTTTDDELVPLLDSDPEFEVQWKPIT